MKRPKITTLEELIERFEKLERYAYMILGEPMDHSEQIALLKERANRFKKEIEQIEEELQSIDSKGSI